MALAAAQVGGEELGLFAEQGLQSSEMAFGEIHHMDVVPHPTAIRSGPVASIHLKTPTAAHRHLAHKREEVVGSALGVFANAATGVGPHGIEVAQPGDAPARFTGRQIGQQLLHSGLGLAVGVDGPHRRRLRDRHLLRDAIHGGAAAEHDRAAAMGPHG